MRNIVLGICYDGTNYAGFQRQKNLPTIQGEIEDKLMSVLKEDVRIKGASRTDAGVHAKGQVVNFLTGSSIPVQRFPYILNDRLPRDIRVIWAKEGKPGFHARFSAISRTYKYIVYNKNIISPFVARYALIYPESLDLYLMREAGEKLVGEHDFSPFSPEKGKTIRRLQLLDIRRKKNIIIFTLEANAFLKGMVRSIIGYLLQIGSQKLPKSVMNEIFNGKYDFKSILAEPQGLYLWKVKYDSSLFKEE
ncbi:tRNA pseudouridine(38-40) synthase TruA [bacterium]|nr:tRNA pseudouridine(38-40) synthase TruA [bacterium]